MKINILTAFPNQIKSNLEEGIFRIVRNKNIVNFNIVDLREFSEGKYKKIDEKPYGEEDGMLLRVDILDKAIRSLKLKKNKSKLIFPSPKGKILDLNMLNNLKTSNELTFLLGHYEGVDERIFSLHNFLEISIGDYILSGGELASLVIIDSLLRLLKDSLGNEKSILDESVYTGLLESPHFTKPDVYKGLKVPKYLKSGNHLNISLIQFRESLLLTKKRRPDLFQKYVKDVYFLKKIKLSKDELNILKEVVEK